MYYLKRGDIDNKMDDMMGMQNCNLHNLPENYTMRYCKFAQAHSSRLLPCIDVAPTFLCGRRREREYCWLHTRKNVRKDVNIDSLRDEDPEDGVPAGHVTSISVLRSHRRLGLANKLMKLSRMFARI